MDDPDDRALDLLAELLELPESRRSDALARACGSDTDLRARVDHLLAECEQMPTGFLGGDDRADHVRILPERIGQFRILREIGAGGMGVVYEAEQDSPKRRVAVKVIRPGHMTARQSARFRHEADILGRLQHPGIAQVFEVGTATTPFGAQPYFAMELVEGLPLDRHVEEHQIGVRERLALMARVCDAVQAAHQRGIIHRDLKPANILVIAAKDNSGEHIDRPKILDFGVARLTDAEHTFRTEAGELLGTLTYMSPEQIADSGQQVDARSDVYALGVMLYELLLGSPPHNLRGHSLPDAARIIVDEEPSRLGYHDSMYRGDIETIVAKALEKEADRRYQSAAGLADDIRRFLADQPVVARAPSTAYQLRKFVRRNKALVAGALATAVALLAGTVTASYFAVKASAHAAESARREAAAVTASYRAHLAAAQASVEAADTAAAALYLDQIPPEQRGWEWSVIHARLDRSEISARLPEQSSRVAIGQSSTQQVLSTCQTTPTAITSASWSDVGFTPISRWSVPGDFNFPAFSPDGQHIVTAQRSPAAAILVIDPSTGAVVDTCPTSPSTQNFSVQTAPADPSAKEIVDRAADLPASITSARLAFSSDGSAVGAMPPFDVWVSLAPGTPFVRLDHPEGAGDIAFSPDNRLLATAGRDRVIRLFDRQHLTEPVWTINDAHQDAITAIAFSPDGSRLATGSQDRTVKVWNASSGKLLTTLLGHSREITAVAFAQDGNSLLSTDAGTIKRWDLSAPRDLTVLRGNHARVDALAVSPDGSLLASGAEAICLWDVASRTLVATIELPLAEGSIAAITFDPGGTSLRALTRRRGELVEWSVDLLTGESTRIANPRPPKQEDVFDSDGTHHVQLAGGDADTWLMQGDDVLYHWPQFQSRAAAFRDDSNSVAIASTDILLFDMTSRTPITTLRGHTAQVHALAFQPGGTRLASGSEDRTVRIWDLKSNAELLELRGHLDRINALAFTPDGSTLFSGSGDQTVRVWDVRSAADVMKSRAERADLVRACTPRVIQLLTRQPNPHLAYEAWKAEHAADHRSVQVGMQIILQQQLSAQRSSP